VRQLGLQLRKVGCDVDVLTLDDPKQAFVLEYPFTAIALGPSKGGYGYNAELIPWLNANARRYDALIVNGLWQYHGFAVWQAARKLGVPYYVFPHGMLDPWFKRTYPIKHLKKWLYWPWAEYRVLRDARRVLFTSEEEQRLASRSFWLYRVRGQVVPLGINPPPADAARLKQQFLTSHPHLRGRRLLLFMSRIHEKKGCDLLIRAFAQAAPLDPALHLVVAGPDHSGLVATLKELASQLGVIDRITWPGMLQDDMKWGAFYSAEAFALPSHQENFGIAVTEAMACGLPVVISNKINIWREIEADGAGFVAPDSLEGTTKNLRAWFDLDGEQRLKMANCAAMSFQRRFTAVNSANSLLDVLRHSM
jgi:glycosyltransferase involved in cell wall biosynthesis